MVHGPLGYCLSIVIWTANVNGYLVFIYDVIWNVSENELPLEFRPTIVAGLSFFLSYLEGIKGQSISLTFEINDRSYHPVDSELKGFNRVTTRAIVNCFDPDYFGFKANRVFREASFRGH